MESKIRRCTRKMNLLVSHLRWYSKNVSALIAIRWQQTYWRFPFSKFQRQKREIDRLERELGFKDD